MLNPSQVSAILAELGLAKKQPARGVSKSQLDQAIGRIQSQISAGFITPVTVAAIGSGTAPVGWTAFDVSPYMPAGATVAWIRDFLTSDTSGDAAQVEYSDDGSASGRYGAQINVTGAADSDSDSSFRWVPIQGGLIYYQVAGTLTAPGLFEIVLEGFS